MSVEVIPYPDDTPGRLLTDIRQFLLRVARGPLPNAASSAAGLLDRLDLAHPELVEPAPRRPTPPAPGPTTKRLPFG